MWMSVRITAIAAVISLVCMWMGCASQARQRMAIYDDPRAAVYLEQVADRTFEASHPITLEPATIARVLNGLIVVQEKTAVQTLMGSDLKSSKVFSEEEAASLAPWVSKALAHAKSDQQVGFRVIQGISRLVPAEMSGAAVGSSLPPALGRQTEITSGNLFAHGRSLHITMTAYRDRPKTPDTIGGPNRYYRDPTGLGFHEIAFVPEAARRPDIYRQSFADRPPSATVIVNYELLAKLGDTPTSRTNVAASPNEIRGVQQPPGATVSPQQTGRKEAAVSEEDVRALKELIIQKDMELEDLKKELRLLKRQLAERDAQLETLKRKGKPLPRSQDRH